MELSQTAIGTLFLIGFPVGVIFNIFYAFSDIKQISGFWIFRVLIHFKDFIFVIIAGLAAVILVFYVNNGEFRGLIFIGIISGYLLSAVSIAKLIIHIRNSIINIILFPIGYLWEITLAGPLARHRQVSILKSTQLRFKTMMQLASNGFENITEAKE